MFAVALGPLARAALVAGSAPWLLLCLGCEAERPEDPRARAAEPGLVQPGSGGSLVEQAEACLAYRGALLDANDRLGCQLEVPRCPELVYAAGGLECALYSQASVEGCVEVMGDYSDCEELSTRRCLLVAVADEPCVSGPGAADSAVADASGADAGSEQTAGQDGGDAETTEAGASTAADAGGAAEPLRPEAGGPAPVDDAGEHSVADARASVPEAGTPEAGAPEANSDAGAPPSEDAGGETSDAAVPAR